MCTWGPIITSNRFILSLFFSHTLCPCVAASVFLSSTSPHRSKYVRRCRRRRRADFIFGSKRMHEKYTKISVVPLVFLSFAGTDFFFNFPVSFLAFHQYTKHLLSILIGTTETQHPAPTTHLAFHFSFGAYYSERLLKHVYHSMSSTVTTTDASPFSARPFFFRRNTKIHIRPRIIHFLFHFFLLLLSLSI